MTSSQQHPLDIDESDHARNILQKLDSMRKERKNCDLTIRVEEKEFLVNSDVMCAGSDYFDAMFSHDTKEKQEGVVEMKEVKLFAVEKCIDFIYSGKMALSVDECEPLLYCASLMQLNLIGDRICSFLEAHLTTKSFFNIREIATKFSLKTLNTVCDKFAIDCLYQLAGEEEFNNLDEMYLFFLLSSKKSSERRGEDWKLEIALQWIKADQNNREKHLMKIVRSLDATKLTNGYVKLLIKCEPLCINFPEFMRHLALENPLFHGVELSSRPDLSEDSLRPEMLSTNSLFIFDESSRLVQLYRPSGNSLMQVAEYCVEMNPYFTACILEDYLYIFNEKAKAFRLCITEEISGWERIADMLHEHGKKLQCTVVEDSIYVGGGGGIERYQTQGKKWENIDLDGNVCNDSAVVNFERCVFVIGGQNFDAVYNVSKFSPSTSNWISVQSMNYARYNASATVFNCKLYVGGGFCEEDLCSFEMYDVLSNSWTILPKMCSARSWFKLCVVDDQIYAIGNGFDALSVEVYDAETKKWTRNENLPQIKILAEPTVAAHIPIKFTFLSNK